ncbi:MAG: EpsG family protein [Clostridia bacterium]|nr:EpsG family protein [Clostridia bacterium]
MWEFYILLLFPLAIQHFRVKDHVIDYQKKNHRALLFFFVVMTILMALRHESVGTDNVSYIFYFKRFSRLSWNQLDNEPIELGFAYFNKIISLISKEPQFFLAVTAIVTVVIIYPTYKRLCIDSSLTIILYVTMSTFVMSFSGIRQMLAVGIGFIAYEFTRNKKLFPFIICVILAAMVHTSAFMLLIMYPLYHAKISRKWLIAVVPAIAVVFAFNTQIFSVISILLEQFTEYDTSISQTGAYAMLILFAVFSVFSFVIPDETKLSSEAIGLRNFLLFSVVLQMFAPLHTIAMRMNYYYIIFIPLLLPMIIEAHNPRWKKIARVGRNIMVIFLLLYFFYNAYTSTSNLDVFPYRFFWEGV